MTYGELIDELSEKLGLTKKETRELLGECVDCMANTLEEGQGFTIPDLGTFRIEVKDVQKIYNPHHKAHMLIPPKRVPQFTPSSHLKETLKEIRPKS